MKILQVRKKPIIANAIQYNGNNFEDLQKFAGDKVFLKDNKCFVICIEAIAIVELGTYVIKGIKGEFWPVREDIFNETYEILKYTNDISKETNK